MKILVTGANRGLGFFLTKTGLERGHVIFATVRDVESSNMSDLKALQKEYPDRLVLIPMDVTDEKKIKQAKQIVEQKTPSLDAIVNNAGILLGREKTIEQVDLDECKISMDVNVFGPLLVIKHFSALLRNGKNQAIINISSDAASMTYASPNDFPYSLSKAALNMLTIRLQKYFARGNYLVCAVHPGWMRTDMGGENAPLDPEDSAKSIYYIIERKIDINNEFFVDYTGKPLPL